MKATGWILVIIHLPLVAGATCDVGFETLSDLNPRTVSLRQVINPKPRTRDKVGYGKISDAALIKNFGAEDILVVKNADVDPELHDWLKKAPRVSAGDPVANALKLSEYTKQTFNPTVLGGFSLPHPLRRKKYDELTRAKDRREDLPSAVPLGAFIKLKMGECRHNAAALQLALQEAGIPSRLVYGNLRVEKAGVFSENEHTERHAWVVVKDNKGNEHIIDPTYGFDGGTNWPFDRPDYEIKEDESRRYFSRRSITYEYVPDGYGSLEGPRELGPRDYVDMAGAILTVP